LALSVLAQDHFQKREFDAAVSRLHQLTGLRRSSHDWLLLGNCEAARHEFAAAREAFETAVAINPKLVTAQVSLARLYSTFGEDEKARRHREIAERMEQIMKSTREAGF
jgi:cytochrome c-type biogenesis protein CcmH/NrfG